MATLFPGSQEANLIEGQVYVPVDYDVGPDLITQIVNDSSPFLHFCSPASYYGTNESISSQSKVLCETNPSEVQDNSNKNGGEDNIVEMPINSNGVSNVISSDNQPPHTEFLYNIHPIVDLSTSIPEHMPISPSMLSEIKHIPTNVDFPGRYNFTFAVNEKLPRPRNIWYAPIANRVFLTMGSTLPLHFRWQPLNLMGGQMFVRAMVMFSEPQHSQDIVVRCVHHAQRTDSLNINVPENMHSHVIRCKSKNTTYHGSVANNEHLSVLTALGLPQPGIDFVEVLYFFTCKNSCASGMNRKLVNVVFTFETGQGVILGRKTIGVQICSCPRRDMEKCEIDAKKRLNSLSRNLNRSRRGVRNRKALTLLNISNQSNNSSGSSEDIYQMPPIPVYGRDNYYRCLKYMFDLHAGEMYQRQVKEPYAEIMSKITKCMKEVETSRRPDPSTS